MCQRIALAMALACKPKLLIADEPTTALDVGVQAKILLLLKRRNRASGLPMIIITHDFGVVRAIASWVIVMYAGQVQEEGVVDDVLKNPLHPYTQALIGSVPDPDVDGPLKQIPGEPPSLMSIAAGCRFAPRCERAYARCSIEQPNTGTRSERMAGSLPFVRSRHWDVTPMTPPLIVVKGLSKTFPVTKGLFLRREIRYRLRGRRRQPRDRGRRDIGLCRGVRLGQDDTWSTYTAPH